MAPKQSVFRQPGAQHFQLVHRSQRDPRFHDPDASPHVLKAFERDNTKKGKSRADLERALSPADLAHDRARANIGEAADYGVYFDDTQYDYMQHLKPAGVAEDGVDSVLLAAPVPKNAKGKAPAPAAPLVLRDLVPAEALPSTSELPRNFEAQEAVPASIAGFQPDMDPHLRQVLEALDDDAFVDEALEDAFFGALIAEGERGADAPFEFEFDEYGGAGRAGEDGGEGPAPSADDEGWEARFAEFKKAQKAGGASDLDEFSEGGDTVGTLPQLAVIGGKRRRKGTSDASGYSMSSSSMFRNAGLTTLDERFDQIEKAYASDEEEEEEEDDDDADSDAAPQLLTSREDFDSMMDEFLNDFEILGSKLKPVLAGGTGAEKLATLRAAMRADAAGTAATLRAARSGHDDDDDDILMPVDLDERKDRWDCETILSTYSNLENHPRLIRARDSRPVPQIRLDPRTGLPAVVDESACARTAKAKSKPASKSKSAPDSSAPTDESDDGDAEARPVRVTVARARDESKDDKKARKAASKAERQTRRVEKKSTKEQFSAEHARQVRSLVNKEATRVRKL